MEDKEIKNYLKKIGIYSSNQILKHDLIYWWEKKYSDIQKSNLDQNLKKEKLIEINEIRESLEKYQPNELSRLLEAKESIKENKYNSSDEYLKDNSDNIIDESKNLYNSKSYSKSGNSADRFIKQELLSESEKQYLIQGFRFFNLGNECPIKTTTLLKTLQKKLNKKSKIVNINTKNEVTNTYADITKAKNLLGYVPKISFEEGINKFLDWHDEYEK